MASRAASIEPSGWHDVRFANNASIYVDAWSNPQTPPQLELYRANGILRILMQDEEELFESKEIRQTETFLLFEKKKKIVTFVPVSHAEVLIKILSKSGAGQIGNYDMCSFKSKGTRTSNRTKKQSHFQGKKM